MDLIKQNKLIQLCAWTDLKIDAYNHWYFLRSSLLYFLSCEKYSLLAFDDIRRNYKCS